MSEWLWIYERGVDLLNNPHVRAIATVLSVVSFFVSLWAVKRLNEVLTAHRNGMLAEQSRFLDQQWQNLNLIFLTNKSVFDLLHNRTPTPEEALQKENMYYYLTNLLFSAYTAFRNGVLPLDTCASHFSGVVHHFFGDDDEFMRLISVGTYPSHFVEWSRGQLEEHRKRTVDINLKSNRDVVAVIPTVPAPEALAASR